LLLGFGKVSHKVAAVFFFIGENLNAQLLRGVVDAVRRV